MNTRRLLEYLLFGLLLLLPLLYWPVGRDPSSLPRYALAGVLSGVGLLFWSLTQWRARERSIYWQPPFMVLLFLLLWAALSGLWTLDPKTYAIAILQLAGMVLLCFTAIQIGSANNALACLRVAVAGAAVAAGIGVLQYVQHNPFAFLVQYAKPASTFTNKNFAALYFDLLFSPAFILILLSRRRWSQWLAALAMGVIGAFLVMSHTRGSWLGLLVALGAGGLLVAGNRQLRAALALSLAKRLLPLLAAIGLIVGLPALPHGESKDTHLQQNLSGRLDESSNIRLAAYRNALEMVKDAPVAGTGLGGFRLGFRQYMNRVVPIKAITEDVVLARLHSDPLQIVVELGGVGGFLYLFVVGGILWQCLQLTRQAKEEEPLPGLLGFGLLLALLASCVHGLVDFPLRKPSSAVQFWLWSGLAMGLGGRHLSFQRHYVPAGKLVALLGVLGLIFVVYNGKFYTGYLASSADLRRAQQLMRSKDCQAAKAAIDHGMTTFGLDFMSQMYRVTVYSRCPSSVEELATVLEQALLDDPTNTRALLSRGTVALRLGKLKEAERDFIRVTELLPHRAAGYRGLGQVAEKRQEMELARQYYEKALAREPRNAVLGTKVPQRPQP